MQGWGSYKGWGGSYRGGLGHVEVGGSYRDGMGWIMQG